MPEPIEEGRIDDLPTDEELLEERERQPMQSRPIKRSPTKGLAAPPMEGISVVEDIHGGKLVNKDRNPSKSKR